MNKQIQEINEWLDLHKKSLNSVEVNSIDEIIKNLNYQKLSIEKRNNGDNLIIIPIFNKVIEHLNKNASYLNLNEKTILNLIVVQSVTNKLRWSTILAYQPKENSKNINLTEKTIENIFNDKQIKDNGLYMFINFKGNLQYQIRYVEGKIQSFGNVVKKNDLSEVKQNKSTLLSNRCTNWYLETIIYHSDETIEREISYLFTTCDEDGEGGNGGGGDGSNGHPEEPADQTITIHGVFTEYETEYEAEDYSIPQENEPPEINADGNQIPPNSNPEPT